MNTITDGQQDTPRAKTRLFTIALVFFVLGFISIQKFMSDKANQEQVITRYTTLNEKFCAQGYRFPLLNCNRTGFLSGVDSVLITENKPQSSLIRPGQFSSEQSLEYQFSLEPNLSAAVSKLQWTGGDEIEAVKLLTLISTLRYGRQRQSRENAMASPVIANLIEPIWESYPELVIASSCVYCGSHFDVLSSLNKMTSGHTQSLRKSGKGHARLFTMFADKQIYSEQELFETANIFAELGYAGDGYTAEYIGDLLIQQNNYELLNAWASRGMNGGRSFIGKDLDTIPRQTVIAAWENGVSGGYDAIELTEYLASTGYRPALRWVVWMESTDYEYIHGYNYKRMRDRYKSILGHFTDFPVLEGDELSRYYSQNWKNIQWSDTENRWSTK